MVLVSVDRGIELVVVARSAYRRSDWRTTYETFARVEAVERLATDDLAAYATAAWRLGHGREAVRINERVHTLLVRTDPVQAAVKAAELGLAWLARGHVAVARGWADRAALLLRGTAESAAHGYVAYLDVVLAPEGPAVTELRGIAARVGDPALTALAHAAEGITALARQRFAEGYAALDAALLPKLDDRVPMEWAADVYRRALMSAADHADADRLRAWSESALRWAEATDAATYRAIVDVLRSHAGLAPARTRLGELRRVVAEVDAAVAALLDDLLARR
ncbi:chemotaxis protein CheY [Mycolicibacterium cosmeticum]|uniref:chemotaxis protein CheY n=1 Tax=Mycolicibacterium cosmeticum TaxID=258533 RepID=UPI003204D484